MEFTTFLPRLALPCSSPSVDPASRVAVLAQLPDPRKRRGRRPARAVVLTLMSLANLAGETTPRGSAQWARLRIDWLSAVVHLPRRQLPCATP
jgi:DDE family transposase